MADFDVIVLGAGPVGENVADYARQGGLTVAIVEQELVGGECSYWACIPSKAMLRPVQAVAAARRVDGAEQAVTNPVDASAVLGRRGQFVSDYQDSGQVSWLEGAGITLVRGHGRLGGERRVLVDTDRGEIALEAGVAVVVCTGSAATLPPVEGLAQARPWTSRDASAMTQVPRRIAVIGGGVVACEMADVMAGLGAEQVTMIVRGGGLLTKTEPFAGRLVLDGLTARGVDVRFHTSAVGVQRSGTGERNEQGRRDEQDNSTIEVTPVTVELDDGSRIEADELLVATGRRPRTAEIGLDTVGLHPGMPLATTEDLQVVGADPWLFAAGDVTGAVPLTHQGKYQARLLGARLATQARGGAPDMAAWGEHVPTADSVAVPQVIFTDPQVATVGVTAAEAAERGLRTQSVTIDLGAVAGAALHADGYAGTACMVVDVDRQVVVGMTFAGQDVAEMLHAATVAIVGEVPMDRLWHAVPAFPTMSEVWLRLLEQWRRERAGHSIA